MALLQSFPWEEREDEAKADRLVEDDSEGRRGRSDWCESRREDASIASLYLPILPKPQQIDSRVERKKKPFRGRLSRSARPNGPGQNSATPGPARPGFPILLSLSPNNMIKIRFIEFR